MTIFQGVENHPLVERIERLAAEWRLPVEWVAGACRATGIPCALPPGEHADAIAALADDLRAWQEEYLSFTPGSSDPQPGPAALRLRELYRAIYCDAGDMRHIFMLMAAQHLQLFAPTAGRALAEEMRDVFVPVAKMLSMYHLRRAWIEQSMRILQPNEYDEQAGKMGIILDEATSEYIQDTIYRRQVERPVPPAGETLPGVKDVPLTLDERWRLFVPLRDTLSEAFHREWGDGLMPQIRPVVNLPGRVLYRQDNTEPVDSPQLSVRIICRTRGDCYRALGAIHGICTPVGFSRHPALRDYISSPRPNGYRVLQTLCLWTHHAADGPHSRLIRFWILTEEMHAMNEWGVLSRYHSLVASDERPETWWMRINQSSRSLAKRPGGADSDIAAYLREHAPGTTAKKIYCFTPLGEIVWLDEGGTALDFAHRVHSQLIRHTSQILVNGEAVPFDTPIKNGDLIQVVYDLTQSLVDFCWQWQVRSRRARSKIRAALRKQAYLVHPGYQAFISGLINHMDRYPEGRGRPAYTVPAATTSEISRFLERAALRHHAGKLETLYDWMEHDPRLVDKLAHRFISEKIIPDIRSQGGETLKPYPGYVHLCSFCRPTPLDVYVGGQLYRRQTLIIHRKDCTHILPESPLIPLEWGPEESPEVWPLYLFVVNTADSDGLLNGILRLVYDMPHTYLFKLGAYVSEPSRATVELEIAVKLRQLCRDLKRQFIGLAPDTQARYTPLMRDWRGGEVRDADMWRLLENPFTENAVTDWRFFGRDETISSILGWVHGQTFRSQFLLVHGQRRVGKSSLIQRLAQETLIESPNRPVVPVMVNFLAASLDQPRTVVRLLAQRIFNAIDLPVPRLEPDDDPFVWLDHCLLEAERHLGGRRLLIIADEFDADYERFIAQRRQSPTLQRLWAVINSHPNIRWILVVQSVYLADSRLQLALPELPIDVPQIAVEYLPPPVARQLIVDLSTRHGVRFASDPTHKRSLPDRIISLTAGNPYLIHVLCRNLLDRVDRDQRNRIELRDLERTIGELLSRPALFNHLFQTLPDDQQAIVRYIAETALIGEQRPASAIRDELSIQLGLPSEEVAARITLLEQIGVLEVVGESTRRAIGIPIQLLHQWLQSQ